ncbi:YihY/virulence factor BrkB family protein [Sphingomonas parva]|nr:YihY/virulence factor BrkB family protein [Sphingomonas parva]
MTGVGCLRPQIVLRTIQAGWRTVRSAAQDDFGMVASSIAFSSFLSLLPLLALVALTYGAFNDPEEVISDLRSLIRFIPAEARGFIDVWLGEALLQREGSSAGAAISLALLVYSASRAGRSLLYGLNVAYRVDRGRGFLARRATSIVIVAIAAAIITGALAAISILTFVSRFLPEVPFASEIAHIMFWAAAALAAGCGLTVIYRYGPAKEAHAASWRDVVPGAVIATLLWLLATGAFSFYLNRFDSLGRVYGSLAAIVLLQFWLLASAMVFLLGARFNVEVAEALDEQDRSGRTGPDGG